MLAVLAHLYPLYLYLTLRAKEFFNPPFYFSKCSCALHVLYMTFILIRVRTAKIQRWFTIHFNDVSCV